MVDVNMCIIVMRCVKRKIGNNIKKFVEIGIDGDLDCVKVVILIYLGLVFLIMDIIICVIFVKCVGLFFLCI